MKGLALTLTLLAASATALAAPASAPSGAGVAPGRAAAVACEEAALKTLRETRGAAVSAVFNSAPVRVPGAADGGDITLRGSGQVRSGSGAQAFSYSCTIDARSNEVAGVVLRGAGAPERSAAVRAVEPDLSQLSPVACESAAAVALKQRWPAVTRIAFSDGTRTLAQDSSGNAELRGQGTAQPAPNAPATHFSYHCALDARSGRVLAARVAD